jgi:Ca2+-binding EF-hand superfamily protein
MTLLENLQLRYPNKSDAFKAIDKDESGTIDKPEFDHLLEDINMNDSKSTELFDKFAVNGSISLVSFNELWDNSSSKFSNL